MKRRTGSSRDGHYQRHWPGRANTHRGLVFPPCFIDVVVVVVLVLFHERGNPFSQGWYKWGTLMVDSSLRWCSVHPGTQSTNAFCTVVFRYLLSSMYFIHLCLGTPVNTLPMHGVSAMGRKLDGWFRSASAFFFPSRRMTPTFQAWGTHLDDQHQV